MEKILEFVNVTKKYKNRAILENFNLSVEKGDFLCIVGSSGSGKTTLMKMINHLICPDNGEILIHGEKIKEEDIISFRRKIGYVIQGNYLFPHMNVYENISYILKLEKKDKDFIDKRVDEVLSLVGLDLNLKCRYPDELSGGQQQRVGIARAYANNPDILLMDEPFGAVDSINRYQLQIDLKEIHSKTKPTIIFITHDMKEAKKLATHILVLDEGKIMQYGKVDEVFNNPKNEFVKKLIDMAN